MYAVVKTGGKQYRVAPEDIIKIEKIPGEAGDIVELSDVLMVGGDGDAQVGTPIVDGASVAAEVVEQGRAKKIIVFKKKRRKDYKRTKGHRQELTTLRITEILTGGAKPSKKAAAKKPAAKAEKAADEKKAAPKKKAAAKDDGEKKPAAKKAAAKKPAAKKDAE